MKIKENHYRSVKNIKLSADYVNELPRLASMYNSWDLQKFVRKKDKKTNSHVHRILGKIDFRQAVKFIYL